MLEALCTCDLLLFHSYIKHVDVSFQQRNGSELEAEVQALFERNDSLVLCRAAQIGDETVIREFLKKFRNEVSVFKASNISTVSCVTCVYRWTESLMGKQLYTMQPFLGTLTS